MSTTQYTYDSAQLVSDDLLAEIASSERISAMTDGLLNLNVMKEHGWILAGGSVLHACMNFMRMPKSITPYNGDFDIFCKPGVSTRQHSLEVSRFLSESSLVESFVHVKRSPYPNQSYGVPTYSVLLKSGKRIEIQACSSLPISEFSLDYTKCSLPWCQNDDFIECMRNGTAMAHDGKSVVSCFRKEQYSSGPQDRRAIMCVQKALNKGFKLNDVVLTMKSGQVVRFNSQEDIDRVKELLSASEAKPVKTPAVPPPPAAKPSETLTLAQAMRALELNGTRKYRLYESFVGLPEPVLRDTIAKIVAAVDEQETPVVAMSSEYEALMSNPSCLGAVSVVVTRDNIPLSPFRRSFVLNQSVECTSALSLEQQPDGTSIVKMIFGTGIVTMRLPSHVPETMPLRSLDITKPLDMSELPKDGPIVLVSSDADGSLAAWMHSAHGVDEGRVAPASGKSSVSGVPRPRFVLGYEEDMRTIVHLLTGVKLTGPTDPSRAVCVDTHLGIAYLADGKPCSASDIATRIADARLRVSKLEETGRRLLAAARETVSVLGFLETTDAPTKA